jgi:hypothetical protein
MNSTEAVMQKKVSDIKWTREDQAHLIKTAKQDLLEVLADDESFNFIEAWAGVRDNGLGQAVQLLLISVVPLRETLIRFCEGGASDEKA